MLRQFGTGRLMVILCTTVPVGAVLIGGFAYHANGALYVILRT